MNACCHLACTIPRACSVQPVLGGQSTMPMRRDSTVIAHVATQVGLVVFRVKVQLRFDSYAEAGQV